jgi:hypothetical protein
MICIVAKEERPEQRCIGYHYTFCFMYGCSSECGMGTEGSEVDSFLPRVCHCIGSGIRGHGNLPTIPTGRLCHPELTTLQERVEDKSYRTHQFLSKKMSAMLKTFPMDSIARTEMSITEAGEIAKKEILAYEEVELTDQYFTLKRVSLQNRVAAEERTSDIEFRERSGSRTYVRLDANWILGDVLIY